MAANDTSANADAGGDLTPLPTFPVQLERAWHSLMTQIGTTNVGYAHGVKLQRRALNALMASH